MMFAAPRTLPHVGWEQDKSGVLVRPVHVTGDGRVHELPVVGIAQCNLEMVEIVQKSGTELGVPLVQSQRSRTSTS